MSTGAGIAVAMGVMNVAAYAFTMGAARLLGPGQYGAMAATMNLLLVISVCSLGLQATAARRISAHPENVAQIEAEVLRLIWRVAVVLGAVLLLLTPVINQALRLDNLALAALVGPAAIPLTLIGGYAGILQGERRWLPLGLVYMAAGVPRLALGLSFLAWRPTAFVAIAGVTLGALAPVLVGWWILRGTRVTGVHSASHSPRAILRETLHNSQALLAFFALSNLDLIVARNTLSGHEAGLYAGGLILAKMMTFLPQFIVVVAFPEMASASQRTRALTRSLLAVTALGLLCTLAVALVSGFALDLVGGKEFKEIQGQLWAFTLLGTLLALLQLVVYSVLARQGQRTAYIVWLALAGLVAGGLMTSTVEALLTWVILVDGGLLVVLVALSYYVVGRTTRVSDPVDALV